MRERIETRYGKHYYSGDAAMPLADADIKIGEDLPQTSKSIRWRLRVEQHKKKREESRQQCKPKRHSHDDESEL